MSTSHYSPDPGSRSQPRAFSASCDSMDSIEPGSSERQSSWPEVTQQSCQYFFSFPPTSLPRDSGRPKSEWERSHLPVPCGEGGGERSPRLRTLGELRYQEGSPDIEAPSVQWLLYLGLFTTQGSRVLEQKLGNELKLPHPVLPQILSCFSEVSLL